MTVITLEPVIAVPIFMASLLTASSLGFCIRNLLPPPSNPTLEATQNLKRKLKHGNKIEVETELDVRRKAQIAYAGANDHAGEVIVVPIGDQFDLNRTIFGNVSGSLPRAVIKSKVAVQLFWSDPAVSRIEIAYRRIEVPPVYKSDLIEFMEKDCDFSMEHADGSFMEHLNFCYSYSHSHYKSQSALPLFLHSILGVGTNFFPMTVEKIPKLKTLVSESDFVQINAFPAILRLVTGTNILHELTTSAQPLTDITAIRFHRVIDNEPTTLTGPEIIVALNYQLIHLLDFLPCASWLANLDDTFLNNFTILHALLTAPKNKQQCYQCEVNFDLQSGEATKDGSPITLGGFIKSLLPSGLAHKMGQKTIQKFSKDVGHSLEYEIVWA